jgi:polyisoprenyl-teichoic acid--peptidoglycan teichoic acid transferase
VAGTGRDRFLDRRKLLVAAAVGGAGMLVGGGVTFAVAQVARNTAKPDLFGETQTPSASPSPTAEPLATGAPTPSPTVEPGAGIKGPLWVLLAGIDTRAAVPGWQPHADSVLVLHVTAGLDRGYLFSLPRDLVVDIPPFPPSGYGGGRTKLTHAMSAGSRRGRRAPSPAQGFQLLAKTVSRYTGIARFDVGVVITFSGYIRLINAIGGVDMYVDQVVASHHKRPDGTNRTLVGGQYVGPQKVYRPGNQHMVGWQALDYARQRYTAGGDYARQRHQQQLIEAMLRQADSANLVTNVLRMRQVLHVLGDNLIFDGRGRRSVDYAYALRRLTPASLTLVSLPGSSVGSGSGYRGEALKPVGRQFIAELRKGRADAFLRANPSLVVRR